MPVHEEQQLVSLLYNNGQLLLPLLSAAECAALLLRTQGVECVVIEEGGFYIVRRK